MDLRMAFGLGLCLLLGLSGLRARGAESVSRDEWQANLAVQNTLVSNAQAQASALKGLRGDLNVAKDNLAAATTNLKVLATGQAELTAQLRTNKLLDPAWLPAEIERAVKEALPARAQGSDELKKDAAAKGTGGAIIVSVVLLAVLALVNLGLIFRLVRSTKRGLQDVAAQVAQAAELLGQVQTAVQGGTVQKAEGILEQIQTQAAEAQEKLAGVVGEFRDASQQAAVVLEEKLSRARLEEELNQKGAMKEREQNQRSAALEELLRKREAALAQREQALAQQQRSLAQEKAAFQQQQDQARRQDAEEAKVLWPAAFYDSGVLGVWRGRILEGVGQNDSLATNLLLAIFKFEALCRQPQPAATEMAATLHSLSLEAHRFWKGRPEDFNETAMHWRDEFNAMVAKHSLPLEVQAIYPQDRFDTSRMVCAEGSSGSRLYVKEPLSWAIIDKSNPERPKVLHHGVVLTV
jgi:hypothetical protein